MRFSILPLLLCASCADFPDLDGTIDETARNAPFPDLVNIADLTAGLPEPTEDPTADIAARLARLEARAEALRQTELP